MTTVSCQALLFDLDGVLIDSTPAVARVWSRWAMEHHLDPHEVVHLAHGRPSRNTIRELLPDADIAAEDRIVESWEMEDTHGVVFLPGAHRLLESLPRDRWTIATSCTRPLAQVRLRAAGLPIPETIVTSSEVTHGKPHPEPYLKAAEKLGIAPGNCIVVEDTAAGVQAGKAAGARVIGFPTTMKVELLKEAGADWILNDCSAISVQNSHPSLLLALDF